MVFLATSLACSGTAAPLKTTAQGDGTDAAGDRADDDEGDDGDGGDDDDTGGDPIGPSCDEVETPLDAATRTPLGKTGADLLAALPAEGAGDAAWAPGESESAFTFGITVNEGSLRLVESTEVYPDPGTDGPAVGIVCTDRISVVGVLRLVSAAGGLDTLVPTTFELFRDDQGAWPVAFSAGVEATDLGADFDLGSFVETAKYETLRLFVDGEIREGILSGSLVAQGTGSNGETAWAENIEIVTFAGSGKAR
ncbi:MAG TPA: hypothetical protein VFS43_01185 [Polyangiaceae bacterium]|nr:hypothetical protein [Polyangiaceae bacterium]